MLKFDHWLLVLDSMYPHQKKKEKETEKEKEKKKELRQEQAIRICIDQLATSQICNSQPLNKPYHGHDVIAAPLSTPALVPLMTNTFTLYSNLRSLRSNYSALPSLRE